MTMTETPTTPPPAPKPKRKYRRTKRAAPVAAAAPARPKAIPPEFAGLTLRDCAAGCNADGCVISGRGYCAHPRKGGLQGSDMHNGAALDRFSRAKRALGHLVLDLNNPDQL